MTTETREAPKPGDYLCDEGGMTAYWLADAWSFEDIYDELEIERDRLSEVWFKPRWTTDEERADPDRIYEMFGDVEMSSIDTTVFYDFAKPNTPGAYRYYTTEPGSPLTDERKTDAA